MPTLNVVERDYPNTYKKFTSLGPLLDKLGNGSKGIGWNTEEEVEELRHLNRSVIETGISQGRPQIGTDIQAAETILMLAPRSEEHTSELQSLMRISYAVFCLNKKRNISQHHRNVKTTHSTEPTK